jgi:hypothetical protein
MTDLPLPAGPVIRTTCFASMAASTFWTMPARRRWKAGPIVVRIFSQDEFRVALQCRQYALLVRAHLAVRVDQGGRKVDAFQVPRGRSGFAGEGQESVPRRRCAGDGVWIGGLEGEQRLCVRLGLAGRGVQVEA